MDIVVPRWGLTMDEATLVEWLTKVGDRVAQDDPVAVIETDKVDGEVASPAAGVIAEILVEEGSTVEPAQIIARLDPSPAA